MENKEHRIRIRKWGGKNSWQIPTFVGMTAEMAALIPGTDPESVRLENKNFEYRTAEFRLSLAAQRSNL
jgi:hypothetical protein